MYAIRSKKGMLVGMFDERTSALQIKDGTKLWIIPIPPQGMTITTVKGGGLPEETCISANSLSTKPA